MVTAAQVKSYLSKLFYLSMRMRSEAEAVARYRAQAMRTTTTWTDTPNGGRVASSPQAVWVERMMQAQDRLEHIAAELLKREEVARELLDLLDDEREKAILEDYHLHRLNVQKIANKYNYSERQIIRIRKTAYIKLTNGINARPKLCAQIERGTEHGKENSKNQNEQ